MERNLILQELPILNIVNSWSKKDTGDNLVQKSEVSMNLLQTEINTMRTLHGIDVVEKCRSILHNESKQSIEKSILMELTLNSIIKHIWATKNNTISFDESDIQKELEYQLLLLQEQNGCNYIITNGIILSRLQDSQYYHSTNKTTSFTTGHQIVDSGSYANMKLFLDPYMKYSDTRLIVGEKSINLEWYESDVMVDDSYSNGSKKATIQTRYSINSESKCVILNLIDCNDKLNENRQVIRTLSLDKFIDDDDINFDDDVNFNNFLK